MNPRTLLTSIRRRLDALSVSLAFFAPALIRVTVGAVFIRTGWGKLSDLASVTSYFTELGIPAPGFNAALAANTEFFGGILVLIGLGTRLAAFPMAFTMVVAIATAKRADLDGVQALLGFEEWSYLVMFVVLVLLGPGWLSVDGLVRWWLERRTRRDELPRPLHQPSALPLANH